MKILIVITKGDTGGAQMSVLNLARKLKEKGYKVAVGMGSGDFLSQELQKEKIDYYRFRWLRRNHNPLSNLFFAWEIKDFLKNNDFQVVHFNSSNALIGSLGVKFYDKRIKTVFTFRGMSLLDNNYQTNPLLKKIYFWYFKIFLKFIDKP